MRPLACRLGAHDLVWDSEEGWACRRCPWLERDPDGALAEWRPVDLGPLAELRDRFYDQHVR